MTGQLAILNVSAGDTKLSFDPKNKAEVKRARDVVTDMLKCGFCILVEAGRDERGLLYRRVQAFDPATDEYIIASTPEETTQSAKVPSGTPPRAPARRKGRKGATERVPAARSSAIAVAPTSGG
jgi:hypothetical protein